MLDVGAGPGVFAEAFRDAGLEAMALDIDMGMLRIARDLVPGIRTVRSSAEAMSFQDGCFDLVFLGFVLHESPDPLRALSEARRTSYARVAVLEWPYVETGMGPPLRERLSPGTLQDLCRSAGLRSITSRTVGGAVLNLLDKPV